jgi:hypothetical protein
MSNRAAPHIEHLITAMRGDPFVAGYVEQAIQKYSELVLKADPDELTKATNGFVTGESWQQAAEICLAAIGGESNV